jgi:hypothetical protein
MIDAPGPRIGVRSRFGRLRDDLFLFDPSGRSAARAAAWMIVLCVYTGLRSRAAFVQPVPFTQDGHAIASLNEAINEVFCGQWARVSDRHQIGYQIATHPDLTSVPVRQVIRQSAVTIRAYCATLTVPYGNNENTLSEFEALTLRAAARSASAATIGRVLLAVRLCVLLLFSAAVLAAGGSVLMCVALLEIGFGLLEQMRPITDSVYPFIFVMPLLSIALYVALLRRARDRWKPIDLCLLVAVGMAAALGVNARTSHLPVYAMLLAIFFWLAKFRGVTARRAVAAALVVMAAYGAAHWHIAVMRQPPVITYNHSYHTVAHPLVLALAIPENSLSRREGIKWSDEVGIVLARKMDPSVTYLGPTYDRALYQYYWSLWRDHPGEMLGVYLQKWNIAGDTAAERMSGVMGPIGAFLLPWTLVPGGFIRLWALLTLVLVSALAYRRWATLFAAIMLLLSAAAVLLHVETALIMSNFMLAYHNFSIFYYAFTGVVAAQLSVNGVVRLARRLRGRVDGYAPAGLGDTTV